MPGRRQRWRADGPRRRTVLVVLGSAGNRRARRERGRRRRRQRADRPLHGDADRRDQGRPAGPSPAPGASRRRTPRCSSAPSRDGQRGGQARLRQRRRLRGRRAGAGGHEPGRHRQADRQEPGAVHAYENHVAGEEKAIVSDIKQAVPAADVGSRSASVYGGVAMKLPANQVRKVLGVDGVVAVQRDSLEQPQTDVTPQFLGATNIYPQLGGRAHAGEDVTVGILDTGIRPAASVLPRTPACRRRPAARSRCQFGDGSDAAHLGSAGALQQQADRRPRVPQHLPVGLRRAPGRVLQQHDAQVLGPRRRRARHAHRVDRGGRHRRLREGLRHRARTDQRDRARRLRDRLPGLPRAGLLPVRLRRRDPAGDPRRRRRDQLLDQRRRRAVHRRRRARVPGLLQGRWARVNASAGNSGPGAGTAEHGGPWVTTVGASTSPRHFLTTLKLRAADGATARPHRRVDHARHSPAARVVLSTAPAATTSAGPSRPGRPPARSSSASAA